MFDINCVSELLYVEGGNKLKESEILYRLRMEGGTLNQRGGGIIERTSRMTRQDRKRRNAIDVVGAPARAPPTLLTHPVIFCHYSREHHEQYVHRSRYILHINIIAYLGIYCFDISSMSNCLIDIVNVNRCCFIRINNRNVNETKFYLLYRRDTIQDEYYSMIYVIKKIECYPSSKIE